MESLIKKIISNKSIFYKFLAKGFNYWKPSQGNINAILESFSAKEKNVKFLQIGSNDGKSGDPIFKFIMEKNWEGVLIEPVAYLFQKLVANYAERPGLYFENVAISKQDGEAVFYRLKESNNPNLPSWYDQLGSFRIDVILKHQDSIPMLSELLIEESVKTLSVQSLLNKYSLYDLKLIHIDTEGYDGEIIKMIPFDKLKSLKIIIFEHVHLQREEYKLSLNILKKNRFKLFSDGPNTIGIRE